MTDRSIRIAFAKWWPDFDPGDNFIVDILRHHYQVLVSEQADIVFYSVFKGELPPGSYQKVFFTGENRRPNMQEADWAFSFDYDEHLCHPRHLRLPLYAIDVSGYRFRDDWAQCLSNKESSVATKQNFCAYIAFYDNWARCEMFDRLSRYKFIHAPGQSRNNSSSISDDNTEASRVNPDFQMLKREYLKDFKFALTFENSSYPGYTTEKMIDAMMASCIPIYWGNPEIARDFNPRSFININDYEALVANKFPAWLKRWPWLDKLIWRRFIMPKAFQMAIERIKTIDQDPSQYQAILNEPWFHHNQSNIYFDRQRIENRLLEIAQHALAARN